MNNHSLKDKVALVSGSSMGIGKAIAIELAQRGAKVVMNGREKDRLENSREELSSMGYDVKAFIADVRLPDQCAYLIDETILSYGQLDILVNNAGISSRGSLEEMATSNFIMLMETNFNGSAYLSKYALDHLKRPADMLSLLIVPVVSVECPIILPIQHQNWPRRPWWMLYG